MTKHTLAQVAGRSGRPPGSSRTVRSRRPGRGSGRRAAPTLRASQPCPSPTLARSTPPQLRACLAPRRAAQLRPEARAGTSTSGWRLTDRGLAVVLVTGLMIMMAALTVVGLTAVKVTGEGYRASVSATLPL